MDDVVEEGETSTVDFESGSAVFAPDFVEGGDGEVGWGGVEGFAEGGEELGLRYEWEFRIYLLEMIPGMY